MKLCAVDEPFGTLEYHRSAWSMAMSGSKPERCWSTTTSWESRRAEDGAASAVVVGAGVAASAPTTIAPADKTPAQASARAEVGRGTVPPNEWVVGDLTTGFRRSDARVPPSPGHDVVTDAVRRREEGLFRVEISSGRGACEHLPGRPSCDQEAFRLGRFEREQPCGVDLGECGGDPLVVRRRPGVEIARRLLGVAGRAVAHGQQGYPVGGGGQLGTQRGAVRG